MWTEAFSVVYIAPMLLKYQNKTPFGNTLTKWISCAFVVCLFQASICLAEIFEDRPFTWDNATVYFVIPDRFENGDQSNDHSYGRELDREGNPYPNFKQFAGTFHGGDLQGMTNKLNEGYFTELGVSAIWITAPYEQVHGYVAGDHFKHYAYHGYYALDFTEVDENMGTREDLKTFVETAHRKGIRVILDVVLNHPGFNSMKDMAEYDFGQLRSGWDDYYYETDSDDVYWGDSNTIGYNDFTERSDEERWQRWWGSDWIRAGLPGYSPCNGLNGQTGCVGYLPDFLSEARNEVSLPPILQKKWQMAGDSKLENESRELVEFFERENLRPTVRNHIIKWLTDWVREFGVDGYRVDTAKHVELDAWKELKIQAAKAYEEYKARPDAVLADDQELPFWMTAEVYGHGVVKDEYYYNGFDSVINFEFKEPALNLGNMKNIYEDYARKLNSQSNDGFNVLSYISSHDEGISHGRGRKDVATALMLLPGAVQIFYGDETGRQPSSPPPGTSTNFDSGSRSDMNWGENHELLTHWQKLGQFRRSHSAVGAGRHTKLSDYPFVFKRSFEGDRVIVALDVHGDTEVNVSSSFSDGDRVKDAYTGEVRTVSYGKVNFPAEGVLLLEKIQ